jgi:SAM-dependent methyltransferase
VSAAEAYSRLAGVYDELVVDPCFAEWAEFLTHLWADDPAGVHSVLDVCCGTGLMADELIPRGIRVVGIDASDAMLQRARALLGPDVRLEQVVLPALPIDDVFDAAISTFDGLNYLTLPDLAETLAAIAGRLRPDGWLVFDLHTDAMMQFTLEHPVIDGQDGDNAFVITSTIDVDTRAIDSTIELSGLTPDTSFTETHRQYFHTDDQVTAALASAGFRLVGVTDEYTPVDAGPTTLRATWIARRDVHGGPE